MWYKECEVLPITSIKSPRTESGWGGRPPINVYTTQLSNQGAPRCAVLRRFTGPGQSPYSPSGIYQAHVYIEYTRIHRPFDPHEFRVHKLILHSAAIGVSLLTQKRQPLGTKLRNSWNMHLSWECMESYVALQYRTCHASLRCEFNTWHGKLIKQVLSFSPQHPTEHSDNSTSWNGYIAHSAIPTQFPGTGSLLAEHVSASICRIGAMLCLVCDSGSLNQLCKTSSWLRFTYA